jgi:hypothetical protein
MSTLLVITDSPVTRPAPAVDVVPPYGRFSTGMEWPGAAADDMRIGRFSDGMQPLAFSAATERVGRFSTGMEQAPATPDALRVGSFADAATAADRR